MTVISDCTRASSSGGACGWPAAAPWAGARGGGRGRRREAAAGLLDANHPPEDDAEAHAGDGKDDGVCIASG